MTDNTTLNSGTGGDIIATDDISGVKHQRVKVQYGDDGAATDVSSANPLPITVTGTVSPTPLDALVKSYEDTSFVTGDSPVVFDVNSDLGRDGRECLVVNDGPGDFTLAISNDGIAFSDEMTLKSGESRSFTNLQIDRIRLTWVDDSAYRVVVL